jgi:dUTPase
MSVGADANQPEVHANKMARVEDTLRVKKISEHAVLPVRGSEGAAGYDLASAYECGTSRSRASVLAGETRARRGRDARLRAPHASTTRDRSTRQLDVFKRVLRSALHARMDANDGRRGRTRRRR